MFGLTQFEKDFDFVKAKCIVLEREWELPVFWKEEKHMLKAYLQTYGLMATLQKLEEYKLIAMQNYLKVIARDDINLLTQISNYGADELIREYKRVRLID